MLLSAGYFRAQFMENNYSWCGEWEPHPNLPVKYRTWVTNANKARAKGLTDSKLNQYDKTEELITFYTFAPFALLELRKY